MESAKDDADWVRRTSLILIIQLTKGPRGRERVIAGSGGCHPGDSDMQPGLRTTGLRS